MALEGAEWGAVAGVFVIIFAMIVYNQMAAKRAAARPHASSGGKDGPSGEGAGQYLSRFVVHDGHVVGEVVARDGDALIVKHQGNYRSVPVALAQVANDEVHLRGDVDWDVAAQQGQEWLERNRKGKDDAVTSQMTTSDDVKRPAYQAFQDRRKEVQGDLPSDSEDEEE